MIEFDDTLIIGVKKIIEVKNKFKLPNSSGVM